VAKALPAGRPIRFIDIGSGFGGLVMHLAAQRPESSFQGIELAPLPWLASRVRAAVAGSRAHFFRGDYARLDFADYDVIFAYLSPAAMPALWDKACHEMRPGTLLLSYEFPIPGVQPSLTIEPGELGPLLYGWEVRTAEHA
jgi:SAM-dependent methyltransferase